MIRLPPLLSTKLVVLVLCPAGPRGQAFDGRVEQARVVVDQCPVLLGAEQRCSRAQVGAGAAAHIHDGGLAAVPEVALEHLGQLLAA